MRLLFSLSLLVLTTCASSDEAEQPIPPQELGYRYTVICRNELQDCYDTCAKYCPKGYLVMNRVRGRKVSDDVLEYSLVIRCKDKR
jgi:hypothetical protein